MYVPTFFQSSSSANVVALSLLSLWNDPEGRPLKMRQGYQFTDPVSRLVHKCDESQIRESVELIFKLRVMAIHTFLEGSSLKVPR